MEETLLTSSILNSNNAKTSSAMEPPVEDYQEPHKLRKRRRVILDDSDEESGSRKRHSLERDPHGSVDSVDSMALDIDVTVAKKTAAEWSSDSDSHKYFCTHTYHTDMHTNYTYNVLMNVPMPVVEEPQSSMSDASDCDRTCGRHGIG